MKHQISISKFQELLFAGKFYFSIKSKISGESVGYKVRKSNNNEVYHISILAGKNEKRDYVYVGTYTADKRYVDRKNKFATGTIARDLSRWIFDKLIISPEQYEKGVELYHIGLCARCGHTLKNKQHIQEGLGEHCKQLLKH